MVWRWCIKESFCWSSKFLIVGIVAYLLTMWNIQVLIGFPSWYNKLNLVQSSTFCVQFSMKGFRFGIWIQHGDSCNEFQTSDLSFCGQIHQRMPIDPPSWKFHVTLGRFSLGPKPTKLNLPYTYITMQY